MAFGASLILKSLGVEVSDHDIKMLEALIPQIPGKANEVLQFIGRKAAEYDARFDALEVGYKTNVEVQTAILQKLTDLEEQLNATGRNDIRSAVTTTGTKRANGGSRTN